MGIFVFCLFMAFAFYAIGSGMLIESALKRIQKLEDEKSEIQIRTQTLERIINDFDVLELDNDDIMRRGRQKFTFSEYWNAGRGDGGRNH